MKFPDYPSNREADESGKGHCPTKGGKAPLEEEAKSVDLFAHQYVSWG